MWCYSWNMHKQWSSGKFKKIYVFFKKYEIYNINICYPFSSCFGKNCNSVFGFDTQIFESLANNISFNSNIVKCPPIVSTQNKFPTKFPKIYIYLGKDLTEVMYFRFRNWIFSRQILIHQNLLEYFSIWLDFIFFSYNFTCAKSIIFLIGITNLKIREIKFREINI